MAATLTPGKKTTYGKPKFPAAPFTGPLQSGRFGGLGLGGHLSMPSAPNVAYAPAAPQQTSMAAPMQSATAPDIRDPSYWLNLANVDEYYGTQKAQFGEQRRQDIESRDRALTILGEKEPEDIRKTQESANKAGLFYSGILGRDLGNLRTDYARQREGIGSDFTGRENQRQIGESSLNTQYGPGGIKYRESLLDAAKRAEENARNNPPPPQDTSGPAALAQQMNPLPGLGNLPLSTGFAGLDPSKQYRQASNGRLQVKNSNGTWRYVN